MTTTTDATLGDLVTANPAAARVLDGFGLDYCCHGERTLRHACEDAGVDAGAVEAAIAATAVDGDTTWATLDPPALADHILATHHRYLHEELPALDALAAKVQSVHGERHPELAEVRGLVRAIREDLEPHMLKEERVLFPAIHAIAAGRRDFPFGTIENPIRMMGIEHEQVGDLLARLRDATAGYAVPADGCASYRSLYERLEALELDTHLHVHKENHTLFPAAVALYAA
ncbi:MAG TPA: iron-sulfur cluster repair di-iron protein [Acidimicrobiales bacterium]|nr:iron-sulfur cluster repair di-iron protein [Acidimicrobiales bacterium]